MWEESALVLKPRTHVIRSQKQGYQWPNKKDIGCPKIKKKYFYLLFYLHSLPHNDTWINLWLAHSHCAELVQGTGVGMENRYGTQWCLVPFPVPV